MEIVKIIVLALSGLLLLFVGLMRLTNPIKTYQKNSGITLDNNADLLNEMRGVASVMLCSGVILLLGTVIPLLTTTSFIVGTLIFFGFAVGRLVSLGLDGESNKQLRTGLITELVLGAANVFFLVDTLT